jgi:hypothetical protein
MKRMNPIKKVAPRSVGVNRSGTLNIRSHTVAAEMTEALRAVLAARGPTATADLWRLLGSPSCLSRAQIRRLLRKARNLRTEALSYGGVAETMYGLNGDLRWKSAMQAFFADRRKAHSDKNLAPQKQERRPTDDAENIRGPTAVRPDV